MCKWNKFRGNNSTTISLQSADIGAKGFFDGMYGDGVHGTQTTRSPLLYRGSQPGLMDLAPFCRRVLSQIYSVLLPFWYINFYSIWFATIAMVIERKRGARHDPVSSREASLHAKPEPFSSSLPSHRRFLDPLPSSSPFPRSTITRKGHFAAFARPKRAITAQSATLPSSGRRRYFLRIKIFQIYEVVFSSARLREWFFTRSFWLWCFWSEEECALTGKMAVSYLRKLFLHQSFIRENDLNFFIFS